MNLYIIRVHEIQCHLVDLQRSLVWPDRFFHVLGVPHTIHGKEWSGHVRLCACSIGATGVMIYMRQH